MNPPQNRKPKDFLRLKYDVDRVVVDAMARARIRGDSDVTITIPEDEAYMFFGTGHHIENLDTNARREARMLEINDALLDIFCEQGVVDIVKEMALEYDFELDEVCDKCYCADSIFGVQHTLCAATLHVPEIERPCDLCATPNEQGVCDTKHWVCRNAVIAQIRTFM